MECSDLFGAAFLLQLALEKVLKQVVIAEPNVFHVQGDQKKVVLLQFVDERVAVGLVLTQLGIRSTQRIAQI